MCEVWRVHYAEWGGELVRPRRDTFAVAVVFVPSLFVWETYAGVRSGWDYFEEDRCYVNGHYTDSSCTLGMSSPLIIGAGMAVNI